VDRPLVLPAGVTELGVSYRYRSYVDTDTGSRTGSGTPDVYLEHSFGRVTAGLGAGQLGYGWFAIDTRAFPQRVGFSVGFSAPQADDRYFHRQAIAVSHKLIDPERLALLLGGGLELSEQGYPKDYGEFVEGQVLALGGWLALEFQLSTRVALNLGGSLGSLDAPVIQSAELDARAALSAAMLWVIALDTWDLRLSGGLGNVTNNTIRSAMVGIQKRWGL
jgi:hypothetical protein